MHSKGAKVNINPSSRRINAQYKMIKQIWNWKQIEIILWKKKEAEEGRKEISEERMREVEESDN